MGEIYPEYQVPLIYKYIDLEDTFRVQQGSSSKWTIEHIDNS